MVWSFFFHVFIKGVWKRIWKKPFLVHKLQSCEVFFFNESSIGRSPYPASELRTCGVVMVSDKNYYYLVSDKATCYSSISNLNNYNYQTWKFILHFTDWFFAKRSLKTSVLYEMYIHLKFFLENSKKDTVE